MVGKVTSFVTLDEQAALLRQLRVLDAEVAAIAEEQATIVALLERYEQEQNSSQRRAAAYETHQRRKTSSKSQDRLVTGAPWLPREGWTPSPTSAHWIPRNSAYGYSPGAPGSGSRRSSRSSPGSGSAAGSR